MNASERDFSERLLAAESPSPTLQAKHEQEVRAMLEQPLTPARKWSLIGAAAMGIGFLAVFGTAAVFANLYESDFPILGTMMFVVGAVFGLAWAVLAISILRRGSYNLRTHGNLTTGLAWVPLVIMITALLLLTSKDPDKVRSVHMLVAGLVFYVMGIAFVLANRIDQAALKNREKLLEIELHLAELTDRLADQDRE